MLYCVTTLMLQTLSVVSKNKSFLSKNMVSEIAGKKDTNIGLIFQNYLKFTMNPCVLYVEGGSQ